MSTLRQYPIHDWKDRWGLLGFVETGTLKGASVLEACGARFDPVLSCEVEPTFVAAARASVAREFPGARATIIEGASAVALPKMLRAVADVPCLFFLDAHIDPCLFDGAVETRSPEVQPLATELGILGARDLTRDVILIDDLHFAVREAPYGNVTSPPAWRCPPPPFKTLRDLMARFPGHVAQVFQVSDYALLLSPRL